jgi:AcrR family transcriptional regulator
VAVGVPMRAEDQQAQQEPQERSDLPAEADRPIGPRSPKGARTRSRLLDAAKEIFEENGFLDARISDISERAGLSHGSFYHYFESKEEVFREVARAQEDQLGSHSIIDSGLLDSSAHPTMEERLAASNRRYLADYRDEAGIMGVIEQVSRYDDEVRRARLAQQEIYTKQTEEAIQRLQRQGLADPELDPAMAASALTAMVTRFAEMWFVQGQLDFDFDAGADQLTRLCMNALRLKDKPAVSPAARSR